MFVALAIIGQATGCTLTHELASKTTASGQSENFAGFVLRAQIPSLSRRIGTVYKAAAIQFDPLALKLLWCSSPNDKQTPRERERAAANKRPAATNASREESNSEAALSAQVNRDGHHTRLAEKGSGCLCVCRRRRRRRRRMVMPRTKLPIVCAVMSAPLCAKPNTCTQTTAI